MDLLLKNANIITMDSRLPRARWIAVNDGKVAAVGDRDDYPDAKEVLDLSGKTVLPGFIDSHFHGLGTSVFFNAASLQNAKSIEEILDLVSQKCQIAEDEEAVVFGIMLDPENLEEKRFPTRWDLDRVSGKHPVLLVHNSAHAGVTNSKGLELSNIPLGSLGLEMEGDEPNGVLINDYSFMIAMMCLVSQLPEETLTKYYTNTALFAASKGVTTIHSLDGSGDEYMGKAVTKIIKQRSSFPIHIVPYWETWNPSLPQDLGLKNVGGCLTLDGSRTTHTMALSEPYFDKPHLRGNLYHSDEKIYEFVSDAHARNMQIAMHAIGDRAIDQLIHIIKRVTVEQGANDHRHRIEHFSLPTERHIEMAAELGVVAPMQPAFAYRWGLPGGQHEQALGKERANRMENLANVIRNGVVVCGGSDCPVTFPDPLMGIQASVHNPLPDKNISMDEAIKLFTYNGAYAAHEEDVKGSIEPGKLADLVVLDEDPYTVKPDSIGKINIHMTIVAGKKVYPIKP